jgi:hypothetical protein
MFKTMKTKYQPTIKTKLKINNTIEMEKKFFVFPPQTNSFTQYTQQHRLLWSTAQFSKKFENLL